MVIPKIIHQIWIGNKIFPNEYKGFCDEMKRVHIPLGYKYYLWGNELFYIYNDDPFINNYRKDPERYKYAYIADRFRMLLLRDIGCIYVDADAKIIKPFDVILNKLKPHITYFSGMRKKQEISGALIDITVIGSSKNSRIVRECLSTYKTIGRANGGKVFSDKILKEVDSDVALFNYKYFYDNKITENTVVLHDTDLRLFSWRSEGKRKGKLKLKNK